MKRKRVLVITLQSVRNYGSVLQTLATQTLLDNHGFESEIINYVKPGADDRELVKTWATNSGKNEILTRVVLTPTILRWKSIFDSFNTKYLKLTKTQYHKPEDFYDHPLSADAFCVGSDQVWNSTWNGGILTPFFLEFTNNSDYRFAYSSSFGKSQLQASERRKTKKLLERFDRISVRESQGLQILDDLGIEGGTHLLDPTLALDGDYWRAFASKATPIKKPYLLIYQLNSSPEFDAYAKLLSKHLGLRLVRICTRYDQILKNGHHILVPTVERFVNLFVNATFVLTDSFHGTGFCINLNRPFLSVYPESFSSRISSILNATRLLDRHLTSFKDFQQADKPVDFKDANDSIRHLRKKSDEFLSVIMDDLNREK